MQCTFFSYALEVEVAFAFTFLKSTKPTEPRRPSKHDSTAPHHFAHTLRQSKWLTVRSTT